MSDLAGILNLIFMALTIALIGRALLSWFDPMMRHGISRLLVQITEPIVAPIRQFIPPLGGTFDVSLIVALVLLQVIERVILSSITS